MDNVMSDLQAYAGPAKARRIMDAAAERIAKLQALDAKRQDEWIALNVKLNKEKLIADNLAKVLIEMSEGFVEDSICNSAISSYLSSRSET